MGWLRNPIVEIIDCLRFGEIEILVAECVQGREALPMFRDHVREAAIGGHIGYATTHHGNSNPQTKRIIEGDGAKLWPKMRHTYLRGPLSISRFLTTDRKQFSHRNRGLVTGVSRHNRGHGVSHLRRARWGRGNRVETNLAIRWIIDLRFRHQNKRQKLSEEARRLHSLGQFKSLQNKKTRLSIEALATLGP